MNFVENKKWIVVPNLPAGHRKPMKISVNWAAIIIDGTNMLQIDCNPSLLNWLIFSHKMDLKPLMLMHSKWHWKAILTSNFILVLLLQLELAGSLRSKPAEKRQRFTPPPPEREKLSTGIPWTPISGETECWTIGKLMLGHEFVTRPRKAKLRVPVMNLM